jgi:hypothetical protein
MLWYSLQFLPETFLSSFVKLRKAIISFMSVHPLITRFPLKGFLWNLIFEFFFTYIPCILIITLFSPSDAQLDSLTNNFKFALKLTLKSSYMFRCKTPHQRAHYLSLAKVTDFKMRQWMWFIGRCGGIYYYLVLASVGVWRWSESESDFDKCDTAVVAIL